MSRVDTWAHGHVKRRLALMVLLGACVSLFACSEEWRAGEHSATKKEERYGGGVSGLNYSSDAIEGFSVTGPRGMNGGGANMSPAYKDGPATAGEMCCIGIPKHWQPDTKLEIEWVRDRFPYSHENRTGAVVMKATVTVPQYGLKTYGFWAIFLPGDRVKVVVMDGNANGNNSVWKRPADNDPFVAQGVLDEALTKELQESFK
ncbi:DUF3304 domain-containing protein [Cupriavidus sp. UME77]|uniref:DUF3304 domain-containing protein n=1 Tax=Cupriavidus sp. UME77 TaxID=1862321 RepID=UPI00351C8150